MSTFGITITVFVCLYVAFAIGICCGEAMAHQKIVRSCERLGAFMYGNKVIKVDSVTDLTHAVEHRQPLPRPTRPAPDMPIIKPPRTGPI